MESKILEGAAHWRFPSVGPALLISMRYIDLGRWVAAFESGAQFGSDVALLILFFNCFAILCQYLATCVSMASQKNLAEICSKEYSRLACISLGVQAEISLVVSELNMMLGIAYGLSCFLGVELFLCIFLAAVCSILLPYSINFWVNFKAEALYSSITIVLAFYVLGVLISQPGLPLVMSGFFPRLDGENAHSLMALLGSNIVAHNFYVHSTIVQQNRRPPNTSLGSLFHDHFFAILFILSGIFLVDHVLMNLAASVFSSADVLNFEDVNLLMHQVFRSPIAPSVLLLVLLFSFKITAMTWDIGGQAMLQYFFGIHLSSQFHHISIKALAIIPVLYCASTGGADGMHQLIIFCQIIQAILLPSSAIPLFRLASSKFVMGAFKIPWYLEILAHFAFLAMFTTNIIFLIEMFFGNSNWIINLSTNMGGFLFIHQALLLFACSSICLTLYLAIVPLKSARTTPDSHMYDWSMLEKREHLSEDHDPHNVKYNKVGVLELIPVSEKSIEGHSNISKFDMNVDCFLDRDSHQYIHGPPGINSAPISLSHNSEKTKSVVDGEFRETVDKAPAYVFPDNNEVHKLVSEIPIENMEGSMAATVHKVNDGKIPSPIVNLSKGILPTPLLDSSIFGNAAKVKGSDGFDGAGSLPKLCGLGRAARKQFSAILDEFWGHLFDFHGKLTQEGSSRRLDNLLGLDLKIVGSSVKMDATRGEESSNIVFSEIDRGPNLQAYAMDYNSHKQKTSLNFDRHYGARTGLRPWPQQNMQPLDTYARGASRSIFDATDRQDPLSSRYSDTRDYQPATVNGYEMASYLRMLREGRDQFSSNSSIDQAPNSSVAPSIGSMWDRMNHAPPRNDSSSCGAFGFQSPTTSGISGVQVQSPCTYEPTFIGSSESAAFSSNVKKYHTSPDISMLIASIKNSTINDRSSLWGDSLGGQLSLGQTAYERSPSMNHVSRSSAPSPSPFDEHSSSRHHGDAFFRSNFNKDAGSMWYRQPCEQLFDGVGMVHDGDKGVAYKSNIVTRDHFSTKESETRLLQSLRFCIMKLLKLEGSDWLFQQAGGIDEELIDRLAAMERQLLHSDASESNRILALEHQCLSERKSSSIQLGDEADPAYCLSLNKCGDCCFWRAELVVSFGVWCIRRILELSVFESRPELWGKYTYVLNRLQGVLEPAFSTPRCPLLSCRCLEPLVANARSSATSMQTSATGAPDRKTGGSITTGAAVLDIIKDVESALSGRKGRSGTAAGDIAFPKGKENLVSVLKRYKRRLPNKPPVAKDAGLSSRKSSTLPSFAS